jgi:hypothetical protein
MKCFRRKWSFVKSIPAEVEPEALTAPAHFQIGKGSTSSSSDHCRGWLPKKAHSSLLETLQEKRLKFKYVTFYQLFSIRTDPS